MDVKTRKMLRVATEVCDLLKSIANPHRLVILCQLVGGEKSVGQLAESLGIRDSAASQNLALMRKAGIVTSRRDGQTMWYSIHNPDVRLILETLYYVYCSSEPVCDAPRKSGGKKK